MQTGGEVFLAYNNPEYLSLRYGVTDREEDYEAMRLVLELLAIEGTGSADREILSSVVPRCVSI